MTDRLDECRVIDLPVYTDHRGSLSVLEAPFLPFDPKRLYCIYAVPDGSRRGCHAHRTEKELILALAGSFKVHVSDGASTKELLLDRPNQGLYVPPLVWHELHSFVVGSICAVLASERYNEDDYWRTYEDFLRAIHR